MGSVTCCELTKENFDRFSLDNFVRRQAVTECWRRVNGVLVLRPVAYVEDQTLDERRDFAARLHGGLGTDYLAFGAFAREQVVGFAVLDPRRFGSARQYVDLAEFYVSEPYRNAGIGRILFRLACQRAELLGAKKLYISAHSAKETIAAYRRFGCVEAAELNRLLAEREPFDLQMECPVGGQLIETGGTAP